MPNHLIGIKKSNYLRITTIFMLVLLISLISFLSCGKKKKDVADEVSYSEDTARIVSHLTSGIISSGDRLYLRFVDPVAEEIEIGKTIKSNVFKFRPEIDGETKWGDNRTIVFVPSSGLPYHKE